MNETTYDLPPFQNRTVIGETQSNLCGKAQRFLPPTGLSSIVKGIVLMLLQGFLKRVLALKRYLNATLTAPMSGDDGAEAVYDILNCGPRHRFCSPFLVLHNCLGLGYGCGSKKFVVVAKTLANLDITESEAEKIVREFRESNPLIVRLWRKLQRAIENSVGQNLVVTLPSGNTLTYRSIACRDGEYTALVPQFGKLARAKIYGSQIVENLTQSTARDVFGHGLLKLEEAGFDLILQTHDEAVVEVPESVTTEEVTRPMMEPPSWMPDLPLLVEAVRGKNYAI